MPLAERSVWGGEEELEVEWGGEELFIFESFDKGEVFAFGGGA